MKVRVFHNTDSHFGGREYQHGDRLTLVAEYEDVEAVDPDTALETAWSLLNADTEPTLEDPSAVALGYHERGNRTLCTGDVIEVQGRAFAVGRNGFQPLLRISNMTLPGTSALDLDPIEIAPALDWQQDEPGEWVSSSVPCSPAWSADEEYLLAVVTAADRWTWRVDYHESPTAMPSEGVRTGEAATLVAAQSAAEQALRELLLNDAP